MPRREQPLGPGDEVLVRFARDLRELRKKAGSPTYRQLSVHAHYSAAALSEAASGRKLPTLAVTLAYVAACAGDTEAWEQRWRQLAANNEPVANNDEHAPYLGLAAFQVADADRFFGRERLVADLVARVGERRFLGVFGASGCGKSSILRAGLMAKLDCPAVLFTPGPHPIEECAVRLASALGASAGELLTDFTADPNHLHLRVRQAMSEQSEDADLLLVVDQFEEIFTLCDDEHEREWLVTALTAAAANATSRTRVVLGVRADFYAHCDQYPRLVEALRDGQVLVGAMSEDELRRAVTQPAVHAGYRLETALESKLLVVAAAQRGALPLVSHVLLETWRRRRGTTLTVAGYDAAGGISGALTRTAEDIYLDLGQAQRVIARQIFLRLCALGDGTDDTKRRVHRQELDGSDQDTGIVLDRLAGARLVILDQDSVELAHEALIRHWPRLRNWLTEDRDGLRTHRQLTEATAIWDSHDRDPGALYRGSLLRRAQNWASTRLIALTPREQEFLDTSLAAQAREQATAKRRSRRLRRLGVLLVVLVLIATGATVFATTAQQRATEQRSIAVALGAVRDVEDLIGAEPALAAQISLAAYRLYPAPPTRDGLIATAAAVSAIPLATESAVTLSPDGELSAYPVAEQDLTVLSTISDKNDLERAVPGGARPPRFSEDSSILATVDKNAVARLWDISNPLRPIPLATIPYPTTSVEFNRSRLITSSVDPTYRLWDLTDKTKPSEIGLLPDSRARATVFSEDGRLIAFARTVNGPPFRHVTFWDVTVPATPRLAGQLAMTSDAQITSAAFGRHDQVLYIGDTTGAVTMWEVSTLTKPELVATFSGTRGAIAEAVVSADGRLLATVDAEGVVTIWDISTSPIPRKTIELRQFRSNVDNLMFGPDSKTLRATAASPHGIVSVFQWHLDVGKSAAVACDRITRHITAGEWRVYFAELPYQPPCA